MLYLFRLHVSFVQLIFYLLEKPGICAVDSNPPSEDECSLKKEENECENDFDCFGNAKCCKKGCFTKCVIPAESN